MYRYIFFILTFAVLSCSSKVEYMRVIEPPNRFIQSGIAEPSDKSGTAPLTVECVIKFFYPSYESNVKKPVVKAEIDFSAGDGFIDITNLLVLVENELHLGVIYPYTFSEPGNYTVQVRAEYWDGEVLTFTYPYEFTILPPEGDGA